MTTEELSSYLDESSNRLSRVLNVLNHFDDNAYIKAVKEDIGRVFSNINVMRAYSDKFVVKSTIKNDIRSKAEQQCLLNEAIASIEIVDDMTMSDIEDNSERFDEEIKNALKKLYELRKLIQGSDEA